MLLWLLPLLGCQNAATGQLTDPTTTEPGTPGDDPESRAAVGLAEAAANRLDDPPPLPCPACMVNDQPRAAWFDPSAAGSPLPIALDDLLSLRTAPWPQDAAWPLAGAGSAPPADTRQVVLLGHVAGKGGGGPGEAGGGEEGTGGANGGEASDPHHDLAVVLGAPGAGYTPVAWLAAINTPDHETDASLSEDLLTLLFHRRALGAAGESGDWLIATRSTPTEPFAAAVVPLALAGARDVVYAHWDGQPAVLYADDEGAWWQRFDPADGSLVESAVKVAAPIDGDVALRWPQPLLFPDGGVAGVHYCSIDENGSARIVFDPAPRHAAAHEMRQLLDPTPGQPLRLFAAPASHAGTLQLLIAGTETPPVVVALERHDTVLVSATEKPGAEPGQYELRVALGEVTGDDGRRLELTDEPGPAPPPCPSPCFLPDQGQRLTNVRIRQHPDQRFLVFDHATDHDQGGDDDVYLRAISMRLGTPLGEWSSGYLRLPEADDPPAEKRE